LVDAYIRQNNDAMIDEEDDSFKGGAESIETSLFQGDLYNIPRPSKE
jgi:hypothetical protein